LGQSGPRPSAGVRLKKTPTSHLLLNVTQLLRVPFCRLGWLPDSFADFALRGKVFWGAALPGSDAAVLTGKREVKAGQKAG
jgi:hypothetical protein